MYENLLRSLERTFYGTAAVLFVIIIVIITVFITFDINIIIIIIIIIVVVINPYYDAIQKVQACIAQKRCMHALFLLFSNNCVHPGYEYFFTVDF